MSGFCNKFGLESLIKDATCYKNPENPSTIELILTNNPRRFQTSYVIETGLSDFHRMVLTTMKTSFERLKPRVINYRDYKSFENKLFREELLFELSNSALEKNADGFQEFIEIYQKTVNQYAPAKQKLVRGNHLPFMNKTLSKAIMHRTRFCNKYLRNKTDENKRKYTKQQNYCVSLLRKSKREYYSNLDVKNITDNKTFWKTIKPFLSDKVTSTQKIILIENYKIVKNDNGTARVLDTFFSNILCDPKISDYNNCNPMAENIQEPVLKAIVKYRNHTSILTIGEVCKKNPEFSFRCVDKDEILKEILNLDASKACQDSDIPSRIIKENADIFTDILHSSFNNSIYQSEFPSILQLENITPVLTTDQSTYFQTSQKSLKDPFFVKFSVLWIPIYQSNNMGLEKVTVHSIACW